MATITLDVGGLFSVLDASGIEKQLRRLTGVRGVSVNPVSGSTTVVYDPGKTSVDAIQAAIIACGFHCAVEGEGLSRHVCQDQEMTDMSRADHATEIKPTATRGHAGYPGGKKSSADLTSATPAPHGPKAGHKDHGVEQGDAMAHEMGHGAGVDLQSMVLDMRTASLSRSVLRCRSCFSRRWGWTR